MITRWWRRLFYPVNPWNIQVGGFRNKFVKVVTDKRDTITGKVKAINYSTGAVVLSCGDQLILIPRPISIAYTNEAKTEALKTVVTPPAYR
ncbi:MAG: hypothetical protein KGL39_26140 [Patescibacteria group bacterium]|nr:hypothetical protein [Patescibacteria group bacterium]